MITGGNRLPHLAFIARLVTVGLKKYPVLNTRIETADDGSQEIVSFVGISFGIAAQTDRGLVVPSVRAAEKLSARELRCSPASLPTHTGVGTLTAPPSAFGRGLRTV